MNAIVVGALLAAGPACFAVGWYGAALVHRRGWWPRARWSKKR